MSSFPARSEQLISKTLPGKGRVFQRFASSKVIVWETEQMPSFQILRRKLPQCEIQPTTKTSLWQSWKWWQPAYLPMGKHTRLRKMLYPCWNPGSTTGCGAVSCRKPCRAVWLLGLWPFNGFALGWAGPRRVLSTQGSPCGQRERFVLGARETKAPFDPRCWRDSEHKSSSSILPVSR